MNHEIWKLSQHFIILQQLKMKDILCANPFHLLDLSVFVAQQSLYQSTENSSTNDLSGIKGQETKMPGI